MYWKFILFFRFILFAETYQPRVRRASIDFSSSDGSVPSSIDVDFAVKKILDEYGSKACVIEEPCKGHALRSGPKFGQPDWMDILK